VTSAELRQLSSDELRLAAQELARRGFEDHRAAAVLELDVNAYRPLLVPVRPLPEAIPDGKI